MAKTGFGPVFMLFVWSAGSVRRNHIPHIFDRRDESVEVFLVSQNPGQPGDDDRIDTVSHGQVVQVILAGFIPRFLISVGVRRGNDS